MITLNDNEKIHIDIERQKLINLCEKYSGREVEINITYKDQLKKAITLAKLAQMIIDICCNEFDIDRLQFFSCKRNRNYVDARKIAAYMIRKYCKAPYKQIGQVLSKDHSTIIHYITMCEDHITNIYTFKNTFKIIETKIQGIIP